MQTIHPFFSISEEDVRFTDSATQNLEFTPPSRNTRATILESDGQFKARAKTRPAKNPSTLRRLSTRFYVTIIRAFYWSSLATRKDTPSPLRRLTTRVYVAIVRALYWSFEPRDPSRQFLFYAHNFIIYIFVDLIVFCGTKLTSLLQLRDLEHGFCIIWLIIIQYL